MKLPETELPSNKKFGLFFTFVFLVIAWRLFSHNAIVLGSLSVFAAIAFCVISFVKAEVLLPLNKAWMALGLLLGMIVSPIVLGVIYFGLFTPISMIMRAMGRDELGLKMQTSGSHWKVRADTGTAGSFKNQF